MAIKGMKSKPKPEKKKYRGYSWDKRLGKWRAIITKSRKLHHLGYFSDQESAAKAYDIAAILMFGDLATLNFAAHTYRKDFNKETGDYEVLPGAKIDLGFKELPKGKL